MTTEMNPTVSVAQTIAHQLGGRRFATMTGAKNFTQGSNSLSFKLPGGAGFTNDGINHVKVELMPDDTYKVTFGRVRKLEYKQILVVNDVYADELQDVFTTHTGLETHL